MTRTVVFFAMTVYGALGIAIADSLAWIVVASCFTALSLAGFISEVETPR